MTTLLKHTAVRIVKALLWASTLLAVAAATMAGVALHLLRPAAGEWSATVPMGPFSREVGVVPLWHVVSHPFAMQLGAGRVWHTPHGPVQWQAGDVPGQWRGHCSPCRLQRREWGTDAIVVPRLDFTLQRDAAGQPSGTVSAGVGAGAVQGRWHAQVRPTGAELTVAFTAVPMANVYRTVAPGLPEVARARIDGRLDLTATLSLPARTLKVVPRLTGFRVDGLGTEALADATTACGAVPAAGHGMWLPRAVVAAEDQRFHQHTGYDLDEMAAAWTANGAHGGVVRGGSTLSQQLAKLLFTGDGRSPSRKLRELLYAVELDRTLGKARVLSLYLAVAPWGEGRCGATAAARHYLKKDPARLTPVEAAWLASLLHNPDRERAAMAGGHVNAARVDWVMSQMRPQPPARWRTPAAAWAPPS